MLTAHGYARAEQPEQADVILLNTCSVREHAEERAFGRMSELSGLKRDKPELILGVIGCMAKLQKELIFKRLPKVDLVAGPAELYDLPYLLAEIQEKRQYAAATWENPAAHPAPAPASAAGPAAPGSRSHPETVCHRN